MIRMFAVSLLMSGALVVAQEPGSFKLAAPAGWGGESINLPPGFAPDMKLQGFEHIRFAPGMMKPESDSFFSYAFVFELQAKPVLTESVVKDEFLKYYRGLCKAVLNGMLPDVDPTGFTLELQRAKSDVKPSSDEQAAETPMQYTGTLDWVEPSDGKPTYWRSADIPFDGLVKNEVRNGKYTLTDFGRGPATGDEPRVSSPKKK